jgi:iron complex outermembrane recepter protein
MKKKVYKLLFAMLACSTPVMAQIEGIKDEDLFDMSLEELMNIKVVSASKKSESLFDAPLSASVITRDEISKSGVTSIVEALRLMPGLIVRETSNGMYDVHVRGLDNVPPNSYYLQSANTTTLVMIDNRPVYNYLLGGVFWETLPIDLIDVERIEVVRGPSSTMYGPNAVSGVIHFITRKTEKNGLNATANVRGGTLNTAIANAAVGYQFSSKLNATLSANMQHRGREVEYFDQFTKQWVGSADELAVPNKHERLPNPATSLNKRGANLFVNYAPVSGVDVNVSAGAQESEAHYLFYDNLAVNYSTSRSNTKYLDAKAEGYGLSGQVSVLSGTQNPPLGFPGAMYDFNTTDANLEYEYQAFKGLTFKPGVTFRSAVYDDSRYYDGSKQEGNLNGVQFMETYAASLTTEYIGLNDRLRIIGGSRIDRFTYPKKNLWSYEFAASFKVSEAHMVRAVASRAYRSSSILNTYTNLIAFAPSTQQGVLANVYNYQGNRNLDILNSTMYELGYRGKLAQNFTVDVEAYATRTQNFDGLIIGETRMQPTPVGVFVHTHFPVMNLPFHVWQQGVTASVNYVNKSFQIKPFVTFQRTTLYNYSVYPFLPESANQPKNGMNAQENNIYSGEGSVTNHKFTPSAFGGAFINYQVSSKFNVNLNPYFFAHHTFYHNEHLVRLDGQYGAGHIPSRLFMNASLSYSPIKQVSFSLTGRNLLTSRAQANAREHYNSDRMGRMLLIGATFNY